MLLRAGVPKYLHSMHTIFINMQVLTCSRVEGSSIVTGLLMLAKGGLNVLLMGTAPVIILLHEALMMRLVHQRGLEECSSPKHCIWFQRDAQFPSLSIGCPARLLKGLYGLGQSKSGQAKQRNAWQIEGQADLTRHQKGPNFRLGHLEYPLQLSPKGVRCCRWSLGSMDTPGHSWNTCQHKWGASSTCLFLKA